MRYWFGGRENRLSLSAYPAVGLADARTRREDVRKLIAAGIDPSAPRTVVSHAAQRNVYRVFAHI